MPKKYSSMKVCLAFVSRILHHFSKLLPYWSQKLCMFPRRLFTLSALHRPAASALTSWRDTLRNLRRPSLEPLAMLQASRGCIIYEDQTAVEHWWNMSHVGVFLCYRGSGTCCDELKNRLNAKGNLTSHCASVTHNPDQHHLFLPFLAHYHRMLSVNTGDCVHAIPRCSPTR
jgi:hypothetical protein